MNRRFRGLLTCAILVTAVAVSAVSSGCTTSVHSLPWRPDFEQALLDSRAWKKPMLTYLYTDSCTYCKEMEATTFQDPLLVEKMGNQYLWVKLNAETDPVGSRLREQFSVSTYPTIVLTDYDGSEIDRLSGYVKASDFKKRVEAFVKGPGTFKGLQQRLQENPESLPTHFSLAEKYLERGQLFTAAKHFVRVVLADPGNLEGLTDQSYYWLASTLAAGGHPDEALTQLNSLYTKFPNSSVLPDALLLEGKIHVFGSHPREAQRVLETFVEMFPAHEQRAWAEQLLGELHPSPMPMARSH